MEINAIQINTGSVKADNIAQARSLVAQAVERDRPDVVVLPEVFTFIGASAKEPLALGKNGVGSYFEGNDERASRGHSMISNSWRHMIAQAREGAGQTSAELDLNYLSAVWARILIAQHRIL